TGAEKLALRLSQIEVEPQPQGLPHVSGRIMFRGPAGIANRFAPTDFTGWAGFSGELTLDGKTRLPELSGQLSGAGLNVAGKAIAKRLSGTVRIHDDVVTVPELEADWANGTAWVRGFAIEPFREGIPLRVEHITSEHMDFPGVMRDIDITPNTIVDWHYDHVDIDQVRGAVKPFFLDGTVNSRTSRFAVYDKAYHDPARRRMIGVGAATVVGRWRANSKTLDFYDVQSNFGNSSLPVELVSIPFSNDGPPLIVRPKPSSVLDLSDIGPIANLQIAGVAKLDIELRGPPPHPSIDGTMSVSDLSLGGFDVGNLAETKLHFEPLFVEFEKLSGQKGNMSYRAPSARLDFDTPAGVEFTAAAESDDFDLREFFRIFHMEDDPRFADLSGHGKLRSRIRYLLGGPEDDCDSGRLRVQGQAELHDLEVLGETFSGGDSTFDLDWFDIDAGVRGFRLGVPSVILRKGSGSVFGNARVRPGGEVEGHMVGSHVPLARIDALRSFLGQAEGFVAGAGRLEGNLERLGFTAQLHVSELKARGVTLPPSSMTVSLAPEPGPLETSGKLSGCGRPLPPVYDKQSRSDPKAGTFHASGQLFGGQIAFEDVQLTSQRDRVALGRMRLAHLDLGALWALSPPSAMLDQAPRGTLSGELSLDEVHLRRLFDSRATLRITELEAGASGYGLALADGPAEFVLGAGAVRAPRFALRVTTPGGQGGVLDGNLVLNRDKTVEGRLTLRETSLGVLAKVVPGVERAEGKLLAGLSLRGRWDALDAGGYAEVQGGRVVLSGIASPISNIDARLEVDSQGLRVARGSADWGGGRLELSGGAPLASGSWGTARFGIVARTVALTLDEGVRTSFDADLELTVPPGSQEEGDEAKRVLPRLAGSVDLISGAYERPMTATADIASLTGRGHKTEVDSFDPQRGRLQLDVVVRAKRPLTVKNALVECALELDPSGLRISGTERNFGAVGNVEVVSGGRIFLRRNAFEVKSGLVRFNDPTRMRPEVDVSATTEYRRFENPGGSQATMSSTASASAGGLWRIRLRAYGPPDDLRVDLTSDPPLAQDDIFLLLTVGLTRTELDQARSAGVGSSVALEALGSLSGAESAVTETVPIDEFRFGSVYSARSGRTEPTVTIGKRLSERMRASVTTSLSDTNEVRSNLEYKATPQMSVEGSYDNAQRAGAPALGNLGGDVRWRLEFD
ncbi:MAG TPA: translocation/assembly module TamB domain-containing protein, partial [Polyangiaceae bacterium]|nr:translocation/assembly module TamB domain-containing protein [Polyangiaceae bacterium]